MKLNLYPQDNMDNYVTTWVVTLLWVIYFYSWQKLTDGWSELG